uniref:Stabilizer of axonemal microtubules 1 n=1 Tax=Suricata suricatta TaxID=37032 RepID=A0A673V942_SURSU
MQNKQVCVLDLCLHGRHCCPYGATRIYDTPGIPCPLTEYLENFPTYGSVLPPQSPKPQQEFRAERGKMEGITTFK